ncbi:MAG TPA: SDR family oxidoreductase [Clostridiales bacterium]|nr:SDR family oxidoreductase [Clostridiales bacterium]
MSKQVAIITGGSNGYGKGVATYLAKDGGFDVVIVARDKARLQSVAKEIGADSFSADVTKAEDWVALRKYVIGKYGKIDVLINNAGGGVAIKPLVEQTLEQIKTSLDLNILSCILGCHTFVGDMMAAKSGTIINVASVCAKKGWPGFSVYSAGKGGMLIFTKCLHTELQPYNIRCTTFIPAAGRTDFGKNAGQPENPSPTGFFPEDAGRAMYDIVKLPSHLIVEEYIMWGMDQAVIPM